MGKNAEKIAELKEKVDELNDQIVALNAAGKHTIVPKGGKFQLMGPDGKMMSEHASMSAASSAKKDAEDALDKGADESTENAIKELTTKAESLNTEIEMLEQDGDTEAQIAILQEQLAASKAREEINQKATRELSERMARIETDRRNVEIGTRVKACKIPAFRDALGAVYAYALEHTVDKVKVYSEKDGKKVTEEKTLAEVIDGVVTEINAQSEKLFKALAFSGATVRADGLVEEDAGKEVQKRVDEYRVKHPEVKQYEVAMKAVLAADAELAQQYRAQLGNEQ